MVPCAEVRERRYGTNRETRLRRRFTRYCSLVLLVLIDRRSRLQINLLPLAFDNSGADLTGSFALLVLLV